MAEAGWLMQDADPQASRQATARGPTKGTLRWTWRPRREVVLVDEPLVAADGTIFINALYSGGGPRALQVVSRDGNLIREIPPPGPAWQEQVIANDGVLFGGSGEWVVAIDAEGRELWRRHIKQYPTDLRRTPSGDLMFFANFVGFLRFDINGNQISVLKDETSSSSVFAFDRAANVYTFGAFTWTSEDDAAEHWGWITAWDSRDRQLWHRDLTARSVYDQPENTVKHIWGLDDSAVFLGSVIQCYGAHGKLEWQIGRKRDFARVVELAEFGVALGWDPRLSRAPRLANVVEGWLDYLECASDADGNIYFCPKFHAVSLDPEFRVRWSLRFECEYLWHPVLTPDGTLLIAGGDTLFAIE